MIRTLLRLLTSRETFAEIEAESRDWFWICESCGTEFSVWDLGGIRYRASVMIDLGLIDETAMRDMLTRKSRGK